MVTQRIQYYVKQRSLDGDDKKYNAVVRKKSPLYQNGLVQAMVDKNTTLSRQEIVMVLDLFNEVVLEKSLNGIPIHTKTFRTSISIRGDFDSPEECFDRRKHTVHLNMNPALDMQKAIAREGKPQKTRETRYKTMITAFSNLENPNLGAALYPGGLAEIKGDQFTADPPVTHIFFRKRESSEEIPVTKIHRLKIRRIMFYVPEDLEAGLYEVFLQCEKGLLTERVHFNGSVEIVIEGDESV